MISLDVNIPHLQIAPLVGNLEVGNLEGILCWHALGPTGISGTMLGDYYIGLTAESGYSHLRS